MATITQTSNGNFSPNQNGNGNTLLQLFLTARGRSTKEVRSIMVLISLLTSKAAAELVNTPIDTETEKDLNLKIEQRFISYKPQLFQDFESLHPHYAQAYREAWQESGITETEADGIANHLAYKSRSVLATCGDNPIMALDKLTDTLVEELLTIEGVTEISTGAVRYYLFSELVKCNVFPNPLN